MFIFAGVQVWLVVTIARTPWASARTPWKAAWRVAMLVTLVSVVSGIAAEVVKLDLPRRSLERGGFTTDIPVFDLFWFTVGYALQSALEHDRPPVELR